jgi:RNA recognition motif-containing protein
MEKIAFDIDEQNEAKNEQRSTKKGRIFFRNFPFDITKEEILAKFKEFGQVKEYQITTKFNEKKQKEEIKGFGFVQFPTRKEALEAIKKLNGSKI